MPLTLPCGCKAGGLNDWVCSGCGKCGRCCLCSPTDNTVRPVHIASAAGAEALFNAYRALKLTPTQIREKFSGEAESVAEVGAALKNLNREG